MSKLICNIIRIGDLVIGFEKLNAVEFCYEDYNLFCYLTADTTSYKMEINIPSANKTDERIIIEYLKNYFEDVFMIGEFKKGKKVYSIFDIFYFGADYAKAKEKYKGDLKGLLKYYDLEYLADVFTDQTYMVTFGGMRET
jgi:hypothetical protein